MSKNNWINAARSLSAAGRELHGHGWVPATSGNFSARLDSQRALVTASGRHKGKLSESDFLPIKLDGTPLVAVRPSAETELHLQIYRQFPEAGAVLHCHSPVSTVLSRHLALHQHLVLRDYELLKAFPGITTHEVALTLPIYDNDQDIHALAARVQPWLEQGPQLPAYLIRGHGIYTWGSDVDSCLRHLEALEFLLQCELEQLRLHA